MDTSGWWPLAGIARRLPSRPNHLAGSAYMDIPLDHLLSHGVSPLPTGLPAPVSWRARVTVVPRTARPYATILTVGPARGNPKSWRILAGGAGLGAGQLTASASGRAQPPGTMRETPHPACARCNAEARDRRAARLFLQQTLFINSGQPSPVYPRRGLTVRALATPAAVVCGPATLGL